MQKHRREGLVHVQAKAFAGPGSGRCDTQFGLWHRRRNNGARQLLVAARSNAIQEKFGLVHDNLASFGASRE